MATKNQMGGRKRKKDKPPWKHQGQEKGGAPGIRARIALQPMEETIVEQVFHCRLWKKIHQKQVYILWRNCAHGKPTLKHGFPAGLQPIGRIHSGVGEKHEEEGGGERSWVDCTPCSPFPCTIHSRWWGLGNGGVQPGEKGEVGESVVSLFFFFLFSLAKSILIGNKLIFPKLSLFCLWR